MNPAAHRHRPSQTEEPSQTYAAVRVPPKERNVNSLLQSDIDTVKAQIQRDLRPPVAPNDPLPPRIRFAVQHSLTLRTGSSFMSANGFPDPITFCNTVLVKAPQPSCQPKMTCLLYPASKKLAGIIINEVPFFLVRNAGGSLGFFRAVVQLGKRSLTDNTDHATVRR